MVRRPGPSWWVKIADFGISKRMEGSTGLRTVIGTNGYMAPELLGQYPLDEEEPESDSSDSTYTAAVDIWALGEITALAITKKITFLDRRLLRRYVVRGLPFPVEDLVAAGSSQGCRDFIVACMQRSATARMSAAEAMQHPWIANHEHIDDGGYISDPR